MKKLRLRILKRLIGNTPVIMNVTIETYGITDIKGAEMNGVFENWNVVEIERELEGNVENTM